jgi:hypothetical protein
VFERVRIAEHALSEFKKDRERTERAFYESAKSERDALKAENERLRRSPFELDCMAGKLTTFDAICGYVSKLESDLADAKAEEAGE